MKTRDCIHKCLDVETCKEAKVVYLEWREIFSFVVTSQRTVEFSIAFPFHFPQKCVRAIASQALCDQCIFEYYDASLVKSKVCFLLPSVI